jgi:hypothetical protein
MIPASYNLFFELGATGEADFTLAEDLFVVEAKVGLRKDNQAEASAIITCAINNLTISLSVPEATLAALGTGVHGWQLDVKLANNDVLRIAKGDLAIGYGLDLFP